MQRKQNVNDGKKNDRKVVRKEKEVRKLEQDLKQVSSSLVIHFYHLFILLVIYNISNQSKQLNVCELTFFCYFLPCYCADA